MCLQVVSRPAPRVAYSALMDGPNRTLNRRGQRSRGEILDVASRLMAERGYAATTLSALAAETGLPKSAIYHHFHSKSGLLSAVMAHGADDFFNALTDIEPEIPDSGSVREKLGFILQRVARVFRTRSDFLRLHILFLMSTEAAEEVEVDAELVRVRRDGRAPMVRMLKKALATYGEEVSTQLAESLVYFVIAGFDGAFIAARAEPERAMAGSMETLADAVDALAAQMARSM